MLTTKNTAPQPNIANKLTSEIADPQSNIANNSTPINNFVLNNEKPTDKKVDYDEWYFHGVIKPVENN